MSTRLKVLGGTRSPGAPRLCDTCQSGVITRVAPDSDEDIFCTVTERRLARAAVECNRYVDRNQPSLRDMRQIAWVPGTDSGRRRMGFMPRIQPRLFLSSEIISETGTSLDDRALRSLNSTKPCASFLPSVMR
jgi:uncharacterized cysteine cluster protein YcgN (CxxCxxCC family)